MSTSTATRQASSETRRRRMSRFLSDDEELFQPFDDSAEALYAALTYFLSFNTDDERMKCGVHDWARLNSSIRRWAQLNTDMVRCNVHVWMAAMKLDTAQLLVEVQNAVPDIRKAEERRLLRFLKENLSDTRSELDGLNFWNYRLASALADALEVDLRTLMLVPVVKCLDTIDQGFRRAMPVAAGEVEIEDLS